MLLLSSFLLLNKFNEIFFSFNNGSNKDSDGAVADAHDNSCADSFNGNDNRGVFDNDSNSNINRDGAVADGND